MYVLETGRVGDARRAFSVVLVPNGPNQLNNPGIESGLSPWGVNSGDCALETKGIGQVFLVEIYAHSLVLDAIVTPP